MVNSRPSAALLMVDVYGGFARANPTTTAHIHSVSDVLRQRMPIINIRMSDTFSTRNWPTIPEPAGLSVPISALDASFNRVAAGDIVFSKQLEQNAFSSAFLALFLKLSQINQVYICGFLASACVTSTAKGALHYGFNTQVITDLIADKNDVVRPDSPVFTLPRTSVSNVLQY